MFSFFFSFFCTSYPASSFTFQELLPRSHFLPLVLFLVLTLFHSLNTYSHCLLLVLLRSFPVHVSSLLRFPEVSVLVYFIIKRLFNRLPPLFHCLHWDELLRHTPGTMSAPHKLFMIVNIRKVFLKSKMYELPIGKPSPTTKCVIATLVLQGKT